MVNKVELLSPPMVDLESVKASLADYKVCKLHYHLKFGVGEIIFFFFFERW